MKKHRKDCILSEGEVINETYKVKKLIGEGNFSEVYLVEHKFLGTLAFKVLKPDKVVLYDLDTLINEAKILTKLTHNNIIRVFDANKFSKKDKTFFFISSEFVEGEPLIELLKRKLFLNIDLALSIQKDICAGLKLTHEQDPPIIHRDIKPQNILLSYGSEVPVGKLGDFGLAINVDNISNIATAAGTLTFMAPEGFWNFYNPSSDVFSAGLVFYQMITGFQPWIYDFSGVEKNDRDAIDTVIIKTRRSKPEKPSNVNEYCDKKLDSIIMKSIEDKIEDRFKNGYEFLNAILEYEIAKSESNKIIITGKETDSTIRVKEIGKGFDEIAGMEKLKQTLYNDIILPIEKKELYEKYKITVPNGILLYGPPGCGKTFICQKLAEEVDYNFIFVKPSDIASIYIHGTQEKIAKLFEDAKKNPPTILFIDEIDGVLPKRKDDLGHSYSQEVNEFLTQLSDCSKKGILLIGTTNRPERIDEAILRTGRIDKIIYVPPPDLHARKKLFEMILNERPISDDIDIEELSKETENFITSDIDFIINEASRQALLNNSLISQNHVMDIITSTKPSVSKDLISSYNKFKNKRNF